MQADDEPDELLVTVDGQVGTSFVHGETLIVSRADDSHARSFAFPASSFFAHAAREARVGGIPERDETQRMLTELRIRNFAIIESLTLPLGPGFNVLSGETGAGKSIIVGALGLLLGERGERRPDPHRGRQGDGRGRVRRCQVARRSSRMLDERGIDVDDDARGAEARDRGGRASARVGQRHDRDRDGAGRDRPRRS